jgi:hypothetical protein
MRDDESDSSCVSILEGVDELIDSAFRLRPAAQRPRYYTKTALIEAMPLSDESALTLIETIRERIQRRWDYAEQHSESKENFRFTKNAWISPRNTSEEKRYEKALVKLQESEWPDTTNWANQVPVASGLTGANCDKGRRIDFVHRCADRVYEFIELKIGERSDTPLYAAMEILNYGILYMFYRQADCLAEYRRVHEQENMLAADAIHLMVAAPSSQSWKHLEVGTTRVDLSWLEPRLNAGLSRFIEKSGYKFKMDFQFVNLEPPRFPRRTLVWKGQ